MNNNNKQISFVFFSFFELVLKFKYSHYAHLCVVYIVNLIKKKTRIFCGTNKNMLIFS